MEELTKSAIRTNYWALRKELTDTVRKSYDLTINNLLKEMVNDNVHVFLPIEENIEVNIWAFIKSITNNNSFVGTSIYSKSNNQQTHVELSKVTSYSLGDYNIPIPNNAIETKISNFKFIIVPLLAFDGKGNRIGYGKGIYDSILANCSSNCIKIGVSYFKPEKTIPNEDHDVQLDHCITPFGVYDFNNQR